MQETVSFWISTLRKSFVDYCDQQLHAMGLSQGLLYYILYIGKHPGCTPSQVAGALRADMGHTTRCLEKLEQGGFITRQRRETDRRVLELGLTPGGETAFRRSYQLFTEWDQLAASGLSPQEQKTLLQLLQRLSRPPQK